MAKILLACALVSMTACSHAAAVEPGHSETRCFAVAGADVSKASEARNFSYDRPLNEILGFTNSGHEISRGSKFVIGHRRFEQSDHAGDGSVFTKLTLVFDRSPLIPGTHPVIASQFTEGQYSSFETGNFVVATNAINQITVRAERGKLHAYVTAKFPTVFVMDQLPGSRAISFDCEVEEKSIINLSQWEGGVPTSERSFHP